MDTFSFEKWVWVDKVELRLYRGEHSSEGATLVKTWNVSNDTARTILEIVRKKITELKWEEQLTTLVDGMSEIAERQ